MATYREGAAAPVVVLAINDLILGIEPNTGDVRWEHKVETGIGGGGTTSLLVTPTAIYACNGSKLACLEYPTGGLRWESEVPSGRAALLLDEGRLYVATSSGKLACYTLDGQRLWQNPLKGKGSGPVAIAVPGNAMQADEHR